MDVNTPRAGRNDLVREVFMLIKDELTDTYNLATIEQTCKREIQRIVSNHISIKTNDNLIKEINEILDMKNPCELINKLREKMKSFD